MNPQDIQNKLVEINSRINNLQNELLFVTRKVEENKILIQETKLLVTSACYILSAAYQDSKKPEVQDALKKLVHNAQLLYPD